MTATAIEKGTEEEIRTTVTETDIVTVTEIVTMTEIVTEHAARDLVLVHLIAGALAIHVPNLQ